MNASRQDGTLTWSEASVLVTGGTGSFGNKFVEIMLSRYRPRRLVVFSRDELKQSEMMARFQYRIDHPSLRFFVGDVRDQARLERAMHGVDVVFHAAALKQIPSCEYNPFEAIQTNVIGAENVISAAIDAGVNRVVMISTDKACVDWHSRVQLTDGRALPISAIVRRRQRVVVSTLDGERLAESRVVGWFKNRRAGRAMIRLSYRGAPSRAGHATGVWLTTDHPVLTECGWKKAGDLVEGELLVTAEPAPNSLQVALLVGTLLGDAGLYRNRSAGSRWRLRFGQAADQAEWLNLKRTALAGFPLSPIKVRPARRGGQGFLTCHSRTMSYLGGLASQLYDAAGRKRVPRALLESAFASSARVLLASWFLDDGCYAQPHGSDRGQARLATHGYSKADVRRLAHFLSARGLESRGVAVTVGGKRYWELRFTVEGSRRLFGLIAPSVPPTMRHKLPDDVASYDPTFWKLGSAIRFRAPARLLPGRPPRPRDVYCIAVERTENFVINGLVLHNCQPINLYGATKLCAEKLFVQGNAYGYPRGCWFSVVRYGNVIGSRGSVIPLFAAQRESGRVTVTDRAMTRFWIRLEQGVEFAIRCAELMGGGEIFVPKIPSMRIMDLVATVAPGCTIEDIGIRPGEKLHEILISEDESRQALEYDGMFVIEPLYPSWSFRSWEGGKRPAPGFRYSSDANTVLLSPTEMKELICD